MKEVQLEESWKKELGEELTKPYFTELREFVRTEYATKHIFPHPKDLFSAFTHTPFQEVRVVILGQDPYHGIAEIRDKREERRGWSQRISEARTVPQAMGLCFSVREGVPPPPSLQNIFKEVYKTNTTQDKKTQDSRLNSDLTRWARQGVLLLNSVLTVEQGKPGSHARKGGAGGWEEFTDAAIRALSENREGIVFMLWGNYARKKKELIDTKKHLVLEAPHPSPLSAHAGFFGCGHFAKANEWLRKRGESGIEW